MLPTVRVLILACSASVLSFGATWSGALVDAHCYHVEQRNKNPFDTEQYVDRDWSYVIRYCSPSAKTKRFAVVDPYGDSLNLDAAGNTKAEDLLPKTGKKTRIYVTVTGQLTNNTINVASIQPYSNR